MNICECDNRNSVQNIIVRDLRVLGIKHRQKKFTNKPVMFKSFLLPFSKFINLQKIQALRKYTSLCKRLDKIYNLMKLSCKLSASS